MVCTYDVLVVTIFGSIALFENMDDTVKFAFIHKVWEIVLGNGLN